MKKNLHILIFNILVMIPILLSGGQPQALNLLSSSQSSQSSSPAPGSSSLLSLSVIPPLPSNMSLSSSSSSSVPHESKEPRLESKQPIVELRAPTLTPPSSPHHERKVAITQDEQGILKFIHRRVLKPNEVLSNDLLVIIGTVITGNDKRLVLCDNTNPHAPVLILTRPIPSSHLATLMEHEHEDEYEYKEPGCCVVS